MSPKKSISDAQKQKWQDRFADMQHTGKTYSTMGALQTFAQYWVENEFIIEQAADEEVKNCTPNWTPDYNDEDSVGEFRAEQDMARYMHDTILIPIHRYSCVVMLFATLERELRRLVENLEKEGGLQKFQVKDMKANSYMAKVGKFVKEFYDVKFSDCPEYEALCDLQKIRDCVIHCRGEVSLSRDKDALVKLWLGSKKRRGFAAPPQRDIHIDSQCIKQFIIEVWSFFVWVFNALGWRIAAHWQGDKLESTFEKLKK